MIKYVCDLCHAEVKPPTVGAPRQIITLESINPLTGKQVSRICCADCSVKLQTFVAKMQKEKGIVAISETTNFKAK